MKARESYVSGGSALRWRGSDVRKGLWVEMPIRCGKGGYNTG